MKINDLLLFRFVSSLKETRQNNSEGTQPATRLATTPVNIKPKPVVPTGIPMQVQNITGSSGIVTSTPIQLVNNKSILQPSQLQKPLTVMAKDPKTGLVRPHDLNSASFDSRMNHSI